MILAVDCGNSRLKWGLHENGGWRKAGAVPVSELGRLERSWRRLLPADKVVVANVAGRSVRKRLESLFARRSMVPAWVEAKRHECGVTNAYGRPDQLGPDRWAALIGAWSILHGPCLVVTAGTATTADVLRGDGRFVGGVILPGIDLMKRSLARGTAELPLARGRFSVAPRNTADAIETGCLLAQAGAIERAFATMEHGAACVLSGGAARRIARHLSIPVRLVDNLVLEGVVRIAHDTVK
ncbi:MAG: type III pantothenate kinase [Betaproteobacteria bacterium]|nr:MAG: type III pantothenate kinase [Betaproteobacteria bacterium]TMH93897.1 MAG: type III pantothenate kinase [Betaproteobacteria bacterium]